MLYSLRQTWGFKKIVRAVLGFWGGGMRNGGKSHEGLCRAANSACFGSGGVLVWFEGRKGRFGAYFGLIRI